MSARILNVLLGGWLVAAAFLWSRGSPEFTNVWLTGGAMAVVGVIGMKVPGARWADVALAVWLVCSIFFYPEASGAAVFNQIVVSLTALAVSFVPLASVTPPLDSWSVPPTPDI